MIVITSMTELPHSCMGCPFQKNQKTPFCRAARNYRRGWSNIPAAFGFYIKDDAFPEGRTPWNSRAKWCPLKEVKGADRPQEWIPCSKKMPNEGDRIVVQYADGSLGLINSCRMRLWNILDSPYSKVVAWMYIDPWKGADDALNMLGLVKDEPNCSEKPNNCEDEARIITDGTYLYAYDKILGEWRPIQDISGHKQTERSSE